MTSALTLLLLAFQLLTAVANNPTLPQSFRDTAITVANQAIDAANKEQAAAQTTVQNNATIQVQTNTPATVTPTIAPVFGSVTPQPVYMPTKDTQIKHVISGSDDTGTYYEIRVKYTEDSKLINTIPVTLSGDGTFIALQSEGIITQPDEHRNYPNTITINTHSVLGEDGSIIVTFKAATLGKTITIEANGVTKTINL